MPTVPVVVRYLAPEGVYYVTADVTVRITGGLLGVIAGTQVTLVKDKGDTMLVTDGRDEFELKKSQVTNDLHKVEALRKHIQEVEAASEQARAERDALLRKQQAEELEFLRTHPLAPTPSVSPR